MWECHSLSLPWRFKFRNGPFKSGSKVDARHRERRKHWFELPSDIPMCCERHSPDQCPCSGRLPGCTAVDIALHHHAGEIGGNAPRSSPHPRFQVHITDDASGALIERCKASGRRNAPWCASAHSWHLSTRHGTDVRRRRNPRMGCGSLRKSFRECLRKKLSTVLRGSTCQSIWRNRKQEGSRKQARRKQAGSKKPEQEKEERSLALSAKPTIPCSYQRGRQLTRWRPCPRQVRSSIRGPATGVPSTMTMRPAAALIHAAPWFGTVSRVCAKCALRLLSHLMTPINPSPAASISPTPLGYRRETMFWITAASGRPTNAMLTVGWAPKYAVTAAARTDKAPKPTPSQWPRRKSVMAAPRALDS